MEAPKVTGTEAIEAFQAKHAELGCCKGQYYGPNCGQAQWTPEEWYGDDYVNDTLALFDGSDDEDGDSVDTADYLSAEWDGESLTLSSTPERGAFRYYTLTPTASPEPKGGEQLAYLGAHAGFIFTGCYKGETLEEILREVRWEDEDLALLGLVSCEDFDCGDDAAYWYIVDSDKFAKVNLLCEFLDEIHATFEDSNFGDIDARATFELISKKVT